MHFTPCSTNGLGCLSPPCFSCTPRNCCCYYPAVSLTPYPWALPVEVSLQSLSWPCGCLDTTVPNPVWGPLTGLSTRANSAILYLWIILRIGFSYILWVFGFNKSVWLVLLISLYPSEGINWVVSCLGWRLILFSGWGRPVELRQLIDGSNSLFILVSGAFL